MKGKDKLKKYIIIDKTLVRFLLIISIIGIITGAFLITILNKGDFETVKLNITNFIDGIRNNTFNYYDSLTNCLIINVLVVLAIWILGISVIGIPLIIIIIFLKSLTLGFIISSFITVYKLKGCLLSFIYIFPSTIINLIVFIIISMFAIKLCINIFKSIFKNKSINFKNISNKYLGILVVSLFFIALSALIEVFITPHLLKLFVTLLLK